MKKKETLKTLPESERGADYQSNNTNNSYYRNLNAVDDDIKQLKDYMNSRKEAPQQREIVKSDPIDRTNTRNNERTIDDRNVNERDMEAKQPIKSEPIDKNTRTNQSDRNSSRSYDERPVHDKYENDDYDFELGSYESSPKTPSHPKYDEAKTYIRDMQTASPSMLQRRFKIGYTAATKMLEQMESEGLIGPSEGTNPRRVFMGKETDQSNKEKPISKEREQLQKRNENKNKKNNEMLSQEEIDKLLRDTE